MRLVGNLGPAGDLPLALRTGIDRRKSSRTTDGR